MTAMLGNLYFEKKKKATQKQKANVKVKFNQIIFVGIRFIITMEIMKKHFFDFQPSQMSIFQRPNKLDQHLNDVLTFVTVKTSRNCK